MSHIASAAASQLATLEGSALPSNLDEKGSQGDEIGEWVDSSPSRVCHAAQTPRATHIDQFMNQPATPIHGHSSFTLQEGLPEDAAIQRGVRLGGLGALQPVKGRGALEQGSHGCSASHDCSTGAVTAAPASSICLFT